MFEPARRRACVAIVVEDKILMVRHRHNGREYWTLPGGRIEPGETPEQAAVREAREETGLQVTLARFLFDLPNQTGHGSTRCFLANADPLHTARLGHDPEQERKKPEDRMLQEVAWFPLSELTADYQVSQVLLALR